MKKRIIIAISIVIGIVILAVGGFIIYKMLNKPKVIEVTAINTINLDAYKTSAEKIEAVKNNTVKVINVLDNGTITGTGFFDSDGYLITNSHIVDIKGAIKVIYPDNTETIAQLVSNDISSDVALLAVESPKVLALKTASTLDLKITNDVYAIGYTLNLEGEATTTKGILSARRSAGGIEYLQTDASVDNGASGGPLLNVNGELIGMNSYATSNSSIAMAISSESLLNKVKALKENKNINYIEDKRPDNAISVVLEEIGYKQEDLYNEFQFYKHNKNKDEDNNKDNDNKKEENNNKSNNKDNNKKDNGPSKDPNTWNPYDCNEHPDDGKYWCYTTAKKVTVKGYKSDPGSNLTMDIVLKNEESSISVSVETDSPIAEGRVENNTNLKPGMNIIPVIVTSGNKKKERTVKYIRAIKPITKVSSLKSMECDYRPIERGSNGQSKLVFNVAKLYGEVFLMNNCYFEDNDGPLSFKDNYYDPAGKSNQNIEIPIDLIKQLKIDVTTKDGKLLKSIIVNPYSSKSIGFDELRAELSEDDYTNGKADLDIKYTAITRHNGTFTSINELTINHA